MLATELLMMAGLSVYGPVIAWFLRVRSVVPLAAVGFAAGVVLWTSVFLVVDIFYVDWSNRSMIGMVLIAFGLAVMIVVRDKRLTSAAGISLLWVGIGASAKFLARIGERFHEDSIQILANTLLIFQNGEIAAEVKRGLSYPVMLSLAEEGSFLVTLTPVIFLHLMSFTLWLGWQLLGRYHPRWAYWVSLAVLVPVAASSPMIRVQFSYINSHTLVALGLAICLWGVIVMMTKLSFDTGAMVYVIVGSLLVSWSRFEGMILVLLLLTPLLVSPLIESGRTRVQMGMLLITPVLGWGVWSGLIGAELPVLGSKMEWVAVFAALAVGGFLLVPRFDWLRLRLLPVIVLSLVLLVAWWALTQPAAAEAQARNLVLGGGGWGFVAPGFVALMFFIRRRALSRVGRTLIEITTLAILGGLAVKLLEEGGGLMTFNDSVNRSWMHWVSVFWLSSQLIVVDALTHARRSRGGSPLLDNSAHISPRYGA